MNPRLPLDRSQPPAIQDPVNFEFHLPSLCKHRLSGGIPLYWLNAGVQELVEIDWVFPAGIWQETSPGVAQATARGIRWGTRNHSAREVEEILDFYGASLRQAVHNDYCIISLYTLTKHLDALLPLILELFTEPQFPESELEIYQRNTLQRLKVQLRQSEFVANQQIDAALFGTEHPYGRYTRPETIEALNRQTLMDFWEKAYRLENLQIFMGGKIGQAQVESLEKGFGTTTARKAEAEESRSWPTVPGQKIIRHTMEEQGVQGSIRLGRIIPNRLDPEFPALVMLNTVFGGYFGSRLMKNIREEKGFTYGIYSGMSTYFRAGTQIIQTEVGRQVIDQALEEIYKEMKILREIPVDAEELRLVKNYLLGNILGDLDGPFEILRRWRSLILYGQNADHFFSSLEVYRQINAEKIQELAQKYLRGEEFVELVAL